MDNAHRRTTCAHDCPDACGLVVTVEQTERGERVIAVRGEREHPVTRGVVCPKMARFAETVHGERRVRTALRRTGPKGSGRFAPMPLEEALDEVAAQLGEVIERRGPEAVLPFSYAGSMGMLARDAGHAFFHRMGASRLERTICSGTHVAAWKRSMGDSPGSSPELVEGADLVLVWGANLASTSSHFLRMVEEARRRGARVLLIDPYRNRTARSADEWIPVRPGTDLWLALGMMHVLARDGLLDEAFISRWVSGWEELRAGVLPRWSPAAAAEVTGVPAARIERLAHDYAAARAPFLRLGHGMARHACGGATLRAIAALPALCGAYARSRTSGLLFSTRAAGLRAPFYTREDLVPDPPPRAINMNQLGLALTDPGGTGVGEGAPPVELLFIYQCNPAEVLPDQGRVLAGLARDDLFVAVHEIVRTRTADYADIILPAPTSFETSDLYGAYGHTCLRWVEPALERQGEAITNRELFNALAERMGYDDEVFTVPDRELARRMLEEGAGLDAGAIAALFAGEPVPLRPLGSGPFDPERGFGTPDGRFRLDGLIEAGDGGEPGASAGIVPSRAPAGRPLRFVSVPGHYTLNSSFGDIPSLRALAGEPVVLIHPDEARRHRVEDGAEAEITSVWGTVRRRLRVSDDLVEGALICEGLHWAETCPDGRGVNTLTCPALSDLGRGSALNETWVSIRPVSPA